MNNKDLKFPDGFLWGAATSAYQIEGGLINDWSEWEKSGRRLSKLKAKGLNPLDFQSGQAADSWNRMEEDIACLKKINASAYRFSIDWSRIEPEEGRFDEAALNRYASFVARLQEEEIEPFVTLWHWPIPLWLRDKGGWKSSIIIEYFKKYAERVALALPTVRFWLTLNEPDVYSARSYLNGNWPPQIINPLTYLMVNNNLIKAHRAAYSIVKEQLPNAQVGLASHNVYLESAGGPINNFICLVARWWWNFYIFDKVKNKLDFIGLNFYHHTLLKYGFPRNKNEKTNDMGWELYPEGILPVLKDLQSRYNKPIYITENGTADEDDDHRAWYVKEILKNVHQAIEEGVNVRGYLHWSLLDNFEWADGFGPRFGLFSVDRKTFERKARSSVDVYSEIAKNNFLTL
ncbi:MAG: glycoside hydrolase family 1 protein [Candidatus Falkowbacteria bacterium]|nr:glycoside hydrolase family 1 protein [Candidatus Falkowbacteria bacterium]